jgi:copper chaperone CopZ
LTSQIINFECEHCQNTDSISLKDLQGMPLRDVAGNIVGASEVDIKDKPLLIRCEYCQHPIVIMPE